MNSFGAMSLKVQKADTSNIKVIRAAPDDILMSFEAGSQEQEFKVAILLKSN